MRKSIIYAMLLAMPIVALMTSCEPAPLTEEDVFVQESDLDAILNEESPEGYDIYTLHEFLDKYMTEKGNFWSDTSQYRDRATNGNGLYLFSVDTLPTNGRGIYIRGRVTTDDYAGNFYKAMAIQQIVDGKQQNLRISVDMGSVHGLYQMGQEIIIRCNGLAVGRYSNQPQLCVPAYNNNIYAMNASQKVGWAPGRIPSAVFRNVTHMIGAPDRSLIKYDTLTLAKLFTEVPRKPSIDSIGMDKVRKADGRLIVLQGVSFSGHYQDGNDIVPCVVANPDTIGGGGANVFAPSTQNIGYPQSRLVCDAMDPSPVTSQTTIMCSNSEYAKFAYFYLPGADKNGIANCRNYEGTITGILGWYQDKASDLTATGLDGYEWSITPRGIPGFGIEDIKMFYHADPDDPWIPMEYDPNDQ